MKSILYIQEGIISVQIARYIGLILSKYIFMIPGLVFNKRTIRIYSFMLFAAFASFVSYSQATIGNADYRNFPETKFFIIPPGGFEVKPLLPSFGDRKGNDITLMQFIDTTQNKKINISPKMKRKDTDLSFEKLNINGFEGLLRKTREDQRSNTIKGFFTNNTVAFIISATYNNQDTLLEKSIMTAIKSIRYDSAYQYSPNPYTVFSIDDSKSRFKFSFSTLGNFYVYTPNRASRVTATSVFSIYVDLMYDDNDKNGFDDFIQNLRKPIDHAIVNNESHQKINDLESYTRELYGTAANQPAAVFQRAVRIGDYAILMEGYTTGKIEDDMRAFRELSNTIKRNDSIKKSQ